MSDSQARLALGLKLLKPSQWERFEHFASEFLVPEFENLRTMACPGGDGGRDAELFSPTGHQEVVLQYSVKEDWPTKIANTAERLRAVGNSATFLIYVTNQDIGARADDLKKKVREQYAMVADIRDRNWFLERFRGDPRREAISEALARDIVEPYLAAEGLSRLAPSALTAEEQRAAFMYLGLQFKDETHEKGLTKLTFDALVRSVLRNSDSMHRIGRASIKEGVRALLPEHPVDQVDIYVDASLARLTKRALRHWQKDDEFCLSHQEGERFKDHLASMEIQRMELEKALSALTASICEVRSEGEEVQRILLQRVERILQVFLFQRGEEFARAVQDGRTVEIGGDELYGVIIKDLSDDPVPKRMVPAIAEAISLTVMEILGHPSPAIHDYLRALADSYTLMSFLRMTPDVQSAMEKLFSFGDIWLDTTILLPLIAEYGLKEGSGTFSTIVKAARDAGLSLYVTGGVVEEIERHMYRSQSCARSYAGQWEGDYPFLFAAFIEDGRSISTFSSWLENFRGAERPEEDIVEFLFEEWGIAKKDLTEEAAAAQKEVRYALEEIWAEAHERRRAKATYYLEESIIKRLVSHDVECYVGILQLRNTDQPSALSYKAWWLTLDRTAFAIEGELAKRVAGRIPPSPVLSVDFMVNMLAFGPQRRRISKEAGSRLPILADIGMVRFLSKDLIDEAERVRNEAKDLPERVIRREVRDRLDKAKRRIGKIALSGSAEIYGS